MRKENKNKNNFFESKCFTCKFIKCINFFEIQDEEKRSGGEYYVINETVKSFPFCIVGSCIESLCKCGYALAQNIRKENLPEQPIEFILPQVIRDLKCSVFLALHGHYRNAFQTLRPAMENFLVAEYFHVLQDYDSFVKWLDDQYEIPKKLRKFVGQNKKKLDSGFTIEFLFKKGVLTNEGREWLKKEIFDILHSYLHPTFSRFEFSTECIKCPAAVEFNKEELLKWLTLFQKIVWFILISLFTFFGFKMFIKCEASKEALQMLTIQPEIVPQFTISKEYKDLLTKIKENWIEREKEFKENDL